ncbi:hypothetical protein F511_35979 [Dorcoceras hygrometricum]|uniref:Dystroglycan-like n=1 Tax=Dorcoceras hygrometricum TaxID=472368 RepID=A0A2Z7B225_9LAMI|nr:hypothetical protein F511_35979 [Dorcoceras hygrometricum]
MASSLISNSHHIDFESVFRLDDTGMVQMFETLIAKGSRNFWVAVFYEDALTEFFAHSSVKEDGMVVSNIGGTAIEISQAMFAAAFELPTEGLIDLTDVPKNFVFDARSLFSDSKEQVSMSCLKKALKFHYRLLHDILAKTIYVKAGSFDFVTRDRFLLMTAITFDLKINWSSLLFGVFKEMVTPGSRQAKGYAIQICVLLRNVLGLELGESKSFPVPRILNEKTVHRFVSVNENVGIKEVADAPRARRTPVKKTMSKKRPATGDDEVAPIIKKKRTTKGKPVAVKRLMVEEPDTAISTSGEPVAEDATGEREPVAEVAPGDADAAIEQVLAQLESVFKHQDADRSEKVDTWFDEAFDEEFEIANEERQVSEEVIDVTIEEGTDERSMSRKKRLPESVVAENFDSQVSLIEPARYWGAAPLLIKIWAWQRVCTEAIQFSVSGRLRPASFSSDIVIGNLGVDRLPDYFLDDFEQGVNTDYFVEFLSGSSGQSGSEFDSASSSGDTVYRSPSPPDYAYALGPPILSPTIQEERLYFVQSPDSSPAASPQQESSSSSSSDVSLHFDSADLPLHDHTNTQTSALVDSNVFTNALEDLRSYLSQRIHESTCETRSKVNDVEFSVRGDILKQQAWLRQTFQNACEVLERQSTQMNDLKKGLTAPVGIIFQDLFDIKKNQRAQEAKLNALDGQVAAIRNEQLEFQNKISADLLSLSTQFAEIVDYIRGGDAKKGEGGSSSRPPPIRVERRPLPTPQSPHDVAGGSSAVRIPTFPRTTGTFQKSSEQARRHILESGLAITLEEAAERVRQADIQESDRGKEKEIGQGEKREVVPLKGDDDFD